MKAAFPVFMHSRLAPYGHDLYVWMGPHALFCKILSPIKAVFPKKESAKQKRNFCSTPEQWVQAAGRFCNSFSSFFLACNGSIEEGPAAWSYTYLLLWKEGSMELYLLTSVERGFKGVILTYFCGKRVVG